MCDQPRAAPPPSASPMTGGRGLFKGRRYRGGKSNDYRGAPQRRGRGGGEARRRFDGSCRHRTASPSARKALKTQERTRRRTGTGLAIANEIRWMMRTPEREYLKVDRSGAAGHTSRCRHEPTPCPPNRQSEHAPPLSDSRPGRDRASLAVGRCPGTPSIPPAARARRGRADASPVRDRRPRAGSGAVGIDPAVVERGKSAQKHVRRAFRRGGGQADLENSGEQIALPGARDRLVRMEKNRTVRPPPPAKPGWRSNSAFSGCPTGNRSRSQA